MSNFDVDAFFREFSRVWNDHDLDGVVAQFNEDGVFETSFGPGAVGRRAAGHHEIRNLTAKVFSAAPDLAFYDRFFHFADNVAIVEGSQTGTWSDGTTFETGCVDILSFDNGKLTAKRAYRKDHSR